MRKLTYIRRYDSTLLLALVIALGVHGILLQIGSREFRRDLGWWLRSRPVAAILPAPQSAPQPPPVDRIGDQDDLGKAINREPGDKPMESALSDLEQEQAMMTRDPVGFNQTAGSPGEALQHDPSQQSQQPKSQDAQQQQSAQATAAASQANVFASQESELAQTAPHPSKSRPAPPPQPLAVNPPDNKQAPDLSTRGPVALAPPPKSTDPPSDPQGDPGPLHPGSGGVQPQQQAQQPAQANPAPANASSAEKNSSGTPMPSGDFESYPVSTIALDYVAGKIETRSGRKMITKTLPRLSIAAEEQLVAIDNPYLVLRVNIDASGAVTDVQTIHSCGSENIDLPWERAIDTWWFEPRKNAKTGKPTPDQVDLTIRFR